MKRHVTSIFLVLLLAAFMVCGYFVSPIFVDMLVLIFMAGATYEMFMRLKEAGYKMFAAPPIFVLTLSYPVFYLTQYFVGKGDNHVTAGVQGILLVVLAGALLALSIFTFKPSVAKVEATPQDDSIAQEDSAAEGQTSQNVNEQPQNLQDSEAIRQEGQPSKEVQAAAKGKACGLNDLFANIFVLVYPVLFLTSAWVISYKYSAIFAVLFAILVPIVGSDLFAYLFGKTIGGRKLCPTISPKKTVAGAIGGIIGGMTVAILLWVVFEYVGSLYPSFAEGCRYIPFIDRSDSGYLYKSALIYLALGAICAVVSELGDLAASRIKRALNIKDYGSIFPGHGGFLDRIDSVMYCLVVLLAALFVIYRF